jgi:hypothetical protein
VQYLNTALENDEHGLGSNDTMGTAQSLDGGFNSIGNGASVSSVLGATHMPYASNNDVYVVSRQDQTVKHFDNNGNLLASWSVSSPFFGATSGIEMGPNNDLYVAVPTNYGQGQLNHYTLGGQLLNIVTLPNGANGFYYYPFGFDVASDGSLWVPDPNSDTISHLDANGNLIQSYTLYDSTDNYYVNNPETAQIGPDGAVYIGSGGGYSYVFRLDPGTGNVTQFAYDYGYPIEDIKWSPDNTMYATSFYYYSFHYDQFGNNIAPYSVYLGGYPGGAEADLSGNLIATNNYDFFTGTGTLLKFDPNGNQILRNTITPCCGPVGTVVIGSDMPLQATPTNQYDWYSVTLQAGESMSVATKGLATGGLELFDASGNLLAIGETDKSNIDQYIKSFVNTSGGTATYYIEAIGPSVGTDNYSLVVTKDADFQANPNGDQAHAQPLDGTNTVLGDIRAGASLSTLKVGYYTDFSPGNTGPVAPITQDGLIPVAISQLTGFDLSQIQILMVDESNNGGLSSDVLNALPAIQTWVENGGVFVVHDRFVSSNVGSAEHNPFVIGEPNTLTERNFTYGPDIDVITTGTLVTNGPNGTIDNNTLDGGTYSDHGWTHGDTLPAGAVPILSSGPVSSPARVASFSYQLGAGFVYYGSIPLDYYLDNPNGGGVVANFDKIYAPNVLDYADSLATPPAGWYSFNANDGDNLSINVSLPPGGTGGGQFNDTLNPSIALYDPNGNLVAGGDGVTSISYTVPSGAGGNYAVKVYSADKSGGEYVLNVSGNTAGQTPFTVTSTTPTTGNYLISLSQMTVTFSESVLISSLNNNDFSITYDAGGDTENATSFTINNDHSVTFYFNTIPTDQEIDVTHYATISGVQDLQGDTVQTYTADFIIVNVAPSIISTSVNNGDILPTGSLSVVVTFNQTMDTSFTTQSSFLLSGVYRGVNYSATSFTWGSDGAYPNDQLTLNYSNLPDDNYNLNLYQTGFENPVLQTLTSGDTVNFTLWLNYFGPVSFPTPLQPVLPLGSMVYTGSSTNVIGVLSIVNTYTLNVNSGQHITVDVTPDKNLAPEVFLYAQDGTLLATTATATAGQAIDLNFVPTDDALGNTSTYSIVVDSDGTGTAGLYTVAVTLNGLRSTESIGGGSNDTIGTAQSLDGYYTNTGNGTQELSVLGKMTAGGVQNNDVFVMSRGDGTVKELDPNGNIITQWAVSSNSIFGSAGDEGLELGSNNDLYVGVATGYGTGELIHYSDSGVQLGVIPLPNSVGTYYFYPFNFDVAADGTFWVPDANSYNIYHIDASGNMLQNYYTGIPNIEGCQIGPDGNVYFGSGYYGYYIYQLVPGTGAVNAFAYDYYYPIYQIKWSPDNTMYATSYFGYTFHYDQFGNNISPYYIYTGGQAIVGQADLSGNVWVTNGYDYYIGNGSAAKFDSNGNNLLRTPLPAPPIGLSVAGSDMPITPVPPDQVDYFSLTLNQGESITAVVKSLTGTSAAIEIDDGSGNALAIGHVGASTVDQSIENFVAESSGVYYIKVTSGGSDTYNLVLTRDANFDLQQGGTIAGAQDITATISNPFGSTGGGGAIGTLVATANTVPGTSFDGLHFNQQPCSCLPPDNGFAVGNGYTFEAVNASEIRITDMAGNPLLTEDMNTFFGLGKGDGGDPFVVYDDTASRWYVLQLDASYTGVELAVSVDANPLDGFYTSFIPIGFLDFPKIGFNYDTMVFTGDEIFGSNAVGIYAFNKSTLLSGDFTYNHYTIPGYPTNWLGLMPAKMHGSVSGDPMYFIDDAGFLQGSGTNTAIRVWTGTNLNSGTGTITSVDLTVNTYGYPKSADQPGASGSVATNFAGMISADWRRIGGVGTLLGTQNATLAVDGFSTTHAIVYEVDTDTLTVEQEIDVNSGPGVFSYMPSAAINSVGDIGITWIQSSLSEPVSMYEAVHRADGAAGSYSAPYDAKAGSGYMPYSFRTGDYSTTVTDPADNLTFWSSNEYVPPNPYSDIWATYASSFTSSPPVDNDWYSVNTNAGDNLAISVIGFNSNEVGAYSGEFQNNADPTIELYDAFGNLVATGDASDENGGGAETISYTASGGTYYVHVFSEENSTGEYDLSVQGATGAVPSFNVTSTSIQAGAIIKPPSTITVTFSASIYGPGLVSPSTFQIFDPTNGWQSATAVTVIDDHTLMYTLPSLPTVGDRVDHPYHISGLSDISGGSLVQYNSDFVIDNVPPTVVSTTPANGDVVTAGGSSFSFTIYFSEEIDTTSVSPSSFLLYGNARGASYSPTSFTFSNGPNGPNDVLTITYASIPDDFYTMTLYSSGFKDIVGYYLNGIGDGTGPNSVINFTFDIDAAQAYPTPTTAKVPAGGLIYDPSITDVIAPAGDHDSYTINVNAKETISVVMASSGLQGHIDLYDPNNNLVGSADAPSFGADAVLQPVSTGSLAGVYTIVFSDTTSSQALYTGQVFLNAALDSAAYGGAENSTTGTAQNITDSSVALGNSGADRLGVVGTFQGNPDIYSFNLNPGQSVTATLNVTTPQPSLFSASARTDYASGGSYPQQVTYAVLRPNTGLLDMIAVDLFSNDISIRLNNGDGTFGAPTIISNLAEPEAVAVGDVFGDGNPDIVVANFYGLFSQGSIEVFHGDGNGNFSGPYATFSSLYCTGLALGDFNHDGHLDVATANSYSNTVTVYFGDGSGLFYANGGPITYNVGNAYPWSIAAADLNGDGYLDLVTSNAYGAFYGYGNVTVLLNNGTGDGSFGSPSYYGSTFDYSYGVTTGDFNHSGQISVADTLLFNNAAQVFLGNGTGSLGSPVNYSTGSNTFPIFIATGDILGNGDVDLATGDEYGTGPLVSYLLGNGDGTFQAGVTVSGGQGGNFSTGAAILNNLFGNGLGALSSSNPNYGTVSVYTPQISQVHFELLDPNGNVVASGTTGYSGVTEAINQYTATIGGTYYLEIYGVGSYARNYTATVERSATFDFQNDANSQAAAQSIDNVSGVLGESLAPGGTQQGTNFQGIDFQHQPCSCLPPDNGFAVGNGYVMRAVNASQIRVYDTAGNILLDQDMNTFFGLGQGDGGDPFIVYDDTANRWYVEQLNGGYTGVEIAVSKDGNPLDGFYTSFIQIGFLDFPKIGFNADEMVITGDQIFGSYKVGIYNFNKSTLLSGDFTYNLYTIPGYPTNWLGLMPAKMHGSVSGDPMYFIDDAGFLQGFGTQDHIRVWTGTNLNSGSGTLTSIDLAVNTYGYPNSADQPGAAGSVATNFAGMISADWRRVNGVGTLLGTQNATLAVDGFSTTHSIVYEVDTDTLTVEQEIDINNGAGVFDYMPAAAVNAAGDIGITYMQSSLNEAVSMDETVHRHDGAAGSYATPVDTQAGSGYMPYSFRTGDYSSVVTDPSDNMTFWASSEYVPPNPYSNIWATYISQFTAPPAQEQDWYSVSLVAGETLDLQTFTPSEGPGEFQNSLQPVVYVYDSSNNLVATGTADGDGYNVSLTYVVPINATGGTYYIQVTSANGTSGEYFLQKQTFLPGAIYGRKFNDLNGSGTDLGSDPGLSGWTINLVDNSTNTIVQTTTTASGGGYSFPIVPVGSYTVEEVQQSGWVQTYPQPVPPGTYSDTVTSAAVFIGQDFGNFQLITVSGTVFWDKNDNRVQDNGEPGLPNVTVYLDGVSVVTSGGGGYSFTGVGPGPHTLSEQVPDKYILTSPTGNSFVFSPTSGTNVTENFANDKPKKVIDNGQSGYSEVGQGWQTLNQGWNGTSRTHAATKNTTYAQWYFGKLGGSMIELFVTWVPDASRSKAAKYEIFNNNKLVGTVTVDQTQAPGDAYYAGVYWKSLGIFAAKGQRDTYVQLFADKTGSVDADGMLSLTVGNAQLLDVPSVAGDNGVAPLTPSVLQSVVAEAKALWQGSGLTSDQQAALASADVEIGKPAGGQVATTIDNQIWIDPTAQGHGWFVDLNPYDSKVFAPVGGQEYQAMTGSAAAKEVDLLTVVAHELGHIVGLPDVDNLLSPHDLMDISLGLGTRRLPAAAAGNLDGNGGGSHGAPQIGLGAPSSNGVVSQVTGNGSSTGVLGVLSSLGHASSNGNGTAAILHTSGSTTNGTTVVVSTSRKVGLGAVDAAFSSARTKPTDLDDMVDSLARGLLGK